MLKFVPPSPIYMSNMVKYDERGARDESLEFLDTKFESPFYAFWPSFKILSIDLYPSLLAWYSLCLGYIIMSFRRCGKHSVLGRISQFQNVFIYPVCFGLDPSRWQNGSAHRIKILIHPRRQRRLLCVISLLCCGITSFLLLLYSCSIVIPLPPHSPLQPFFSLKSG